MMRKERAVLTVEASLTLTLFMFFVMFLLSFNRVYSAQNTVSHATLQTADAVSAESMLRANASAENIADLLTVSNHIYAGESIPASALEKLTNGNISEIAKRDFIAAIAETESEADAVLKKYGVKDGLAGIDFSGCSYNADTGETIIFVRYTVELQFPIIGFKEFPMTKAAKVNNMGKETYTITVVSENPEMGTTSGTVKVRKGESTVIAAYPNYGCVFTGWREGGSENPKTLTNVNCDMTFTARFKKSKYSVKADVNNSEYGSTTGSGSYDFNDVAVLTAKPRVNGGYKFLGWDENGNSKIDAGESTSERLEIKVRRDVNVTAVFEPIKYTVTVKTAGRGIGVLTASGKTLRTTTAQGNAVSFTLDFNTPFIIDAESNNFPFWKWSGSSSSTTKKQSLRVPVGGGTYVANFEKPYIKIVPRINHECWGETSSQYSTSGTQLIANIKKSMRLSIETNLKNVTYKWSSNSNAVSVDSKGNITANKVGTATIMVTASDGTTASAKVITKYLVTSSEYRINAYSRNLYKYRYYLPDTVKDYSYGNLNFSSGVGWFFRYLLVDSMDGHATVNPGSTTAGKLKNTWDNIDKNGKMSSYYMHGTNPTGETAYCFETYGGNSGDRKFDCPFFNKGVVIQYVGD